MVAVREKRPSLRAKTTCMQYSKTSTDRELIEGCKAQHRLAQKYLYQRYYGRMLGISMRYTHNESEAIDVLNRAFLKVFHSLDQYEDQGSLSGWIARIVFNTTIDYVRQQVKYRQVMDFTTVRDSSIEAEAIQQLYAEDLYRYIQQLPATTRTVFSLYVIDGYKHREIAEMLEINENTSKWHLAKGKQQLQKVLQNHKRSITYEQ